MLWLRFLTPYFLAELSEFFEDMMSSTHCKVLSVVLCFIYWTVKFKCYKNEFACMLDHIVTLQTYASEKDKCLKDIHCFSPLSFLLLDVVWQQTCVWLLWAILKLMREREGTVKKKPMCSDSFDQRTSHLHHIGHLGSAIRDFYNFSLISEQLLNWF